MKKESWNPEKKGCQLSYSTETLFGMFSSDNLHHKKWLSSKGEGMAAEAIHEKSFAVCGTAEDLVYPDGIISSLP